MYHEISRCFQLIRLLACATACYCLELLTFIIVLLDSYNNNLHITPAYMLAVVLFVIC